MDRELLNIIAKTVKDHRKRAGLTQIQLANIAGVGKASIWDIEHGKETVRFDTLYRTLEALNIKIELKSPLIDNIERNDT